MKTNYFKKADESKKSEFVTMNKKDMESIIGGYEWYLVRDENGKVVWRMILP